MRVRVRVRNAIVLVAVVGVAVLAAPATTANVAVQITRAGFVPRTVAIKVGDTVTWTNVDTVAHQVIFRQRNGLQCPQPLVVQPAATGSCTFTRAGKFDYEDPNQRGGAWKGTVNVMAAPPSVSLQAAPKTLTYGAGSTLSGEISTHASGERVAIASQPCGAASFSTLATLTTTTTGAFSTSAKPTLNTSYQARYKSASSPTVAVKVRPRLRLAKIAPRRYRASATAAVSFRGRYVVFQRYNATLLRWVTLKRVTLRTVISGVTPTKTTSATFRSTLKRGVRRRVVMTQSQVGGCYLAARSNVLTR
jgi:plastocyanin